ncbi:MAG: 2-amino-4-hydroxy-6-hydroxymethyldihydropteridine diphosphokinase [Blastocatellia bacterium]|nr:2-amino-4-hydroxy-6-hydroxymethyldihydropteridine diphosphokinase [Blastocatellia bacterium]
MQREEKSNSISPKFLLSSYKNWAAIGLGSNLGDRSANLLKAISLLINQKIKVIAISNIYETMPEDYLNQSNFLNMVIVVAGDDLPTPDKLLQLCLEIEHQLKRERLINKGPRTIDLDLLLYNNLVIDSIVDLEKYYPNIQISQLDLVLPHPRMHLRGFVLVPLLELLPNGQHPGLKESYRSLLEKLTLDLTNKVVYYQG